MVSKSILSKFQLTFLVTELFWYATKWERNVFVPVSSISRILYQLLMAHTHTQHIQWCYTGEATSQRVLLVANPVGRTNKRWSRMTIILLLSPLVDCSVGCNCNVGLLVLCDVVARLFALPSCRHATCFLSYHTIWFCAWFQSRISYFGSSGRTNKKRIDWT